MRVLIDTNIVLDVLIQREPFFEHSQLVMLASERKLIHGFVSASSITDIFYISIKCTKDKKKTYELVKKLLMGTVDTAAVDGDIIFQALDAEWNDFEDCVQYVVGERISADYIVTRNPGDFKNSRIKVVTPEELLKIIAPE